MLGVQRWLRNRKRWRGDPGKACLRRFSVSGALSPAVSPEHRGAASPSPSESGRRDRRWHVPVPGTLGFLVLIVVVFTIWSPRFASLSNVRTVLFTAAILATATLGQLVVVITRQLDLSVGAVMAATSYFAISICDGRASLGWIVPLVAVLLGVLFGFINGLVVAVLRIPSIVATLGMLSIIRGLITQSEGGRELTTDYIPTWLLSFVAWAPGGVPALVVVAPLLALMTGGMLRYTRFGRNVFAVGSSLAASTFYGLSSKRTVIGAYVFSGVLASLAGVLLAGQIGNVTPDVANGWELQTLAAVVIGGGSLLGGTGSATGAVLGAVVIATINNGLVHVGISGYWQQFVQGAAIVAAVAFDIVVVRRAGSHLTRSAASS